MMKLRLHLDGVEVKVIELEPGNVYTVGRSSSCEIQLDDHPGISRQHFRLYEEGGTWRLQVTSKFGEVITNGRAVSELEIRDGTIFRLPPYEFFCVGIAEQSVAPQPQTDYAPSFTPATQPPAPTAPLALNAGASEEAAWADEGTMVGQVSTVPYIRIVNDADGTEETLRLEGAAWVAGREDTNDILLNDVKSSRRHFEIAATDNGKYTITDLGSSNGTLLNGSKLKANEPLPIRSGDIIGVGSTTMHFEIRDPNFKNKLVVIPQQLTQLPSPNELMGLPANYQGGVVPLDANGIPILKKRGLDFSQPRTKIFAAVASLMIILAAVFGGGGNETNTGAPQQAADPKILAFQKLPEPQKKLVRDTYQLAYNLYLNQKWELSAQQIEKLHLIIPEGYEESHKLREEIRELEATRMRRIAVEEERRRLEENQRRVEQTLANCQPLVATAQTVVRIQECLAEALTLDPENARIQEMIAKVQARIDDQKLRAANRAEYANSVARGRSLYAKAQKTDAAGETLAAIAAWEKFLSASFQDPDGLKEKAQARLKELRGGISKEVSRRLASAEKLYTDGKHKQAFSEVKKAKAVDPTNPQVSELTDRIVRELNAQMQTIYSDSVLEEGLGNIESAKEKWRKILEIDRPDGEYYRRAKSKLQQYGSAK